MSSWAYVDGAEGRRQRREDPGKATAPRRSSNSSGEATRAPATQPLCDPADREALWQRVIERLKADGLSDKEHRMWVAPLHCVVQGDRVWLGAPNRFVREFAERELVEQVAAAFTETFGRPIEVTVCVGTTEEIRRQAANRPPAQREQNRERATAGSAVGQIVERRRSGDFSVVRLIPKGEFPTALTRLPIFLPGWAQTQPRDKDNALPFRGPWGSGRRHGPPLTVYDEDTLIALLRLRQSALCGPPDLLPCPVTNEDGSAAGEEVSVHVVECRVSDIQRMCGASRGGKNNARRLQSVKRLTATRLEFDRDVTKKLGVIGTGTTVSVLDVRWQRYDEDAVLYVQFPPAMTSWLEESYTRLDWEVRCKLSTAIGKAVHRFLSGQPREYQIFTRKLQGVIGSTKEHYRFLAELRKGLEELLHTGWLKEWNILGNGRSKPHKLVVRR